MPVAKACFTDPSKEVVLSNLSARTTVDGLRQGFSKIGAIAAVRVKGSKAFMQFEEALKFNDMTIDGTCVTIERYCVQRPQSADPIELRDISIGMFEDKRASSAKSILGLYSPCGVKGSRPCWVSASGS